MVSKSLSLTIDGKTYQVEVIKPGVIAVDGNVFNVEVDGKRVRVDDQELTASLSDDVAVVSGNLYETEWKAD
jgi:hypothetical protein